uniref:Uncharacterized protein n=1 Tax=Rhizophora mucronata TaxID=61149 RepID=A0A2P2KUH8_RHIMU
MVVVKLSFFWILLSWCIFMFLFFFFFFLFELITLIFGTICVILSNFWKNLPQSKIPYLNSYPHIFLKHVS